MYYIAYGSNMNQEQMELRCPGAQLIGTGLLNGYQLEFNRHATIVESSNPFSAVPVAVWEITLEHEQRLDQYEAFPLYYCKLTCQVDMLESEPIEGMVYQMNRFEHNPPGETYYQGIRDAYESLGFRSEVEQILQPALMRSYRLARR